MIQKSMNSNFYNLQPWASQVTIDCQCCAISMWCHHGTGPSIYFSEIGSGLWCERATVPHLSTLAQPRPAPPRLPSLSCSLTHCRPPSLPPVMLLSLPFVTHHAHQLPAEFRLSCIVAGHRPTAPSRSRTEHCLKVRAGRVWGG